MKAKFDFGLILPALFFGVCEKTIAQSADPPAWAWVKTLSATYGIYGNALALDPAGNGDIYISGGFAGRVDYDPGPEIFNLYTGPDYVSIFISKLDNSGNFVWAKAMGGIAGNAYTESIAIDPLDGAIYTTGHCNGTIDFDPSKGIHNITSNDANCSGVPFCGDIFISKLDSLGNFVWAYVFGGLEDDFGSSIAIDPGNGEVYITGRFKGTVDFNPGRDSFNLISAGLDDVFILKLNKGGHFIWAKAIGGTGNDISRSIAFDPAGGGKVYTTGYFQGTVDFDPGADIFNLTTTAGQYNNFISAIDRSGNFLWAKGMGRVGLISFDHSGSIAVDPSGSGDVYTTGSFQGQCDFNPGKDTFNLISDGDADIFISKLSDSGDFKLARAMGGTNADWGTSLAIQPGGSGNIYTIGNFIGTADFDPGPDSFKITSAGYRDIFISKLDSLGNFQWVKAIKGRDNDFSYSIALDANFLYMTGSYSSVSVSFDSFTTNVNTSGPDLFIAKLNLNIIDIFIATDDLDSKAQKTNVYPNPATNELTIEFDVDEVFNVDFTLFNVLGEAVYYSSGENIGHKKTIDISALATGIYFLELNIEGNKVLEKVVKE